MTQLSPSILAADFARLGEECRQVLDAGADMLHFDVMDGCFVPNISFGVPVLQSLHKALPDAFYDVHLMIRRPLDYVDAFVKAGASCITFHLESESDPKETIATIKKAGCKAGISIKPATPAEELLPLLPELDLVLVMSVEPGFGGQKFMPEVLSKISLLRQAAPSLHISVDGGINGETGRLVKEAGADMLVAGSYVFGTADPAAAIASLR